MEWYKNRLQDNGLLYLDRTKKDVIPMGGQGVPYALEITSFINDSIPNEEDLSKLKEEKFVESFKTALRNAELHTLSGKKQVEKSIELKPPRLSAPASTIKF